MDDVIGYECVVQLLLGHGRCEVRLEVDPYSADTPQVVEVGAAVVLTEHCLEAGLGQSVVKHAQVNVGHHNRLGKLLHQKISFRCFFRTLVYASTMSQMIPDIYGYSQIFQVAEGMSF